MRLGTHSEIESRLLWRGGGRGVGYGTQESELIRACGIQVTQRATTKRGGKTKEVPAGTDV